MISVAAFGVLGFVMERNGYPGRGARARHRHGLDGRAELRHLAHQVERQHPAVLRAAGLRGACGDDLRRAALAGVRPAAAAVRWPARAGACGLNAHLSPPAGEAESRLRSGGEHTESGRHDDDGGAGRAAVPTIAVRRAGVEIHGVAGAEDRLLVVDAHRQLAART